MSDRASKRPATRQPRSRPPSRGSRKRRSAAPPAARPRELGARSGDQPVERRLFFVLDQKAPVTVEVGVPGHAAPLAVTRSPLADPQGVAALLDGVAR